MSESDDRVACGACGERLARSEMFGVEPDLRCPGCAGDVRRRMDVHVRPHVRDRLPIVTLGVLAVAAVLYLVGHFLLADPERWPPWYEDLLRATRAGPWIWSGEVWTLLGSAFWHAGLLHAFFNGWWILELGRAVESGFGRLALLLLVVASAMVASGVEWMIHGPGVGLSGVVYALALFLFVHRRTNAHAARIMNRRTLNFLLMWFVLCIVLTETGTLGVANWAHGAGAAWGWLAGQASLHCARRWLLPALGALTVALVLATPHLAFGEQVQRREAYLRAIQRGWDWRPVLRELERRRER